MFFNKKGNVFLSNNIILELQKWLVTTFVCNMLFYRSETWILVIMERKIPEVFEILLLAFEIYHWMVELLWTNKISNKEVLRRLGDSSCLLMNFRRRRNLWIGQFSGTNIWPTFGGFGRRKELSVQASFGIYRASNGRAEVSVISGTIVTNEGSQSFENYCQLGSLRVC